jgi:hypothetical protein
MAVRVPAARKPEGVGSIVKVNAVGSGRMVARVKSDVAVTSKAR